MNFPENKLGLTRGTILEATHNAAGLLGIRVGEQILIGFDGKRIRSAELNWGVEQLESEIEYFRVWKVVGQMDLSNPTSLRLFEICIERRTPETTEATREEVDGAFTASGPTFARRL